MDFQTALLGEHTLGIWIASLLWSFFGSLAVKGYFLPKGLKWKEFSFVKWFDENLIDFFKANLYAMILIRLGDAGIDIAEYFVGESLPFVVDDFVMSVSIITAGIQYKLHKKIRK